MQESFSELKLGFSHGRFFELGELAYSEDDAESYQITNSKLKVFLKGLRKQLHFTWVFAREW